MCAGVVGRVRAPQLADGGAGAAEQQLELEAAVAGEEAVAEARREERDEHVDRERRAAGWRALAKTGHDCDS